MEKIWDILGLGATDIDLFLRVDHLPRHDEKVLAEPIGEFPGGMIANFCCAASRLGARTALASLVGDDRYGDLAVADLRRCGVDTQEVRVLPGGRTGFCIIWLDASGEKALTVVRTECSIPRQEHIRADSFRQARLVHTMMTDPDFTRWAVWAARERGALVSLDLEPTSLGNGLPDLEEILPFVDLVFPNQAGLMALTGDNLVNGARHLLRLGARIVVVTRGADGCLIVTRDQTIQLPAYHMAVVDTTGAGDCFNGAFVVGYLQGWNLAHCGQFATAAAALTISGVGARQALPSYDATRAFLASQENGGEPDHG